MIAFLNILIPFIILQYLVVGALFIAEGGIGKNRLIFNRKRSIILAVIPMGYVYPLIRGIIDAFKTLKSFKELD